MKLEDYIEIGVIGKAKSFKGEVFIHLKSQEFTDISSEVESMQVTIGNRIISYPIENSFIKNDNTLVVKFKGIDSKEMTELIKNKTVYLPADLLTSDETDELYSHELVNCKVIDDSYGDLGLIHEIDNSTPQLLAYITFKGADAIFPLNDAFIKEINLSKQIIYTQLPEGILEINE